MDEELWMKNCGSEVQDVEHRAERQYLTQEKKNQEPIMMVRINTMLVQFNHSCDCETLKSSCN